MYRILFICHGNICRSPMAEFICRDLVKKQGKETEFCISSCATSTEELGNSVYPPAKAELARHGLSCAGKRAVQLCREDYTRYDLLLCMDDRNIRNAERILGGDPEGKIKKLLSYTGEHRDVSDPWYTGDFATAYRDIENGCRALLQQLSERKK